MAQNQSPAFFAVALLLLLAAAAPLALAQVPPPGQLLPLPPLGPLLGGITINGTLCCTPTGSCPGGPPLVGVPVTLVCRVLGVTVNLGQATTSVNGSFIITIGNLLNTVLAPLVAILGGNLPCTVNVNLPLSDALCPVLNLTNAVLVGVPIIVGTVVSSVTGLLLGLASVLTFRVVVGGTV